MKPKKYELIECPHCGRQYLPAEIFIPKYLLGQPRNILRDVYGQILDYEGTGSDLEETYICDSCNTEFDIKLITHFTSTTTKVGNIDEEYISTSISENNLF